jgi:hypothetical protein
MSFGVRHIASERPSSDPKLPELLGGLLAALRAAGAKDEVGTHLRQPFCHLAPQANRAPGDDGDAPGEIKKLPGIHGEILGRASDLL